MIFLDANYFLRLMLAPRNQREEERMHAAARLMRLVSSGARTATTSEAVLAEVIFVTLDPKYGLSREDVAWRLKRFLTMKGLVSPHLDVWLHAVELWAANRKLSFVDAFSAALSLKEGYELATFDRELSKLDGLSLYEPDFA